MRAFVWTVFVMIATESVGKACLIWKRDFERKPGAMVFDIALGIGMIVWAAWLLGSEA